MKASLKQHLYGVSTIVAQPEGEEEATALVLFDFRPRPGHTLSEIEPEVTAWATEVGGTMTHQSDYFQVATSGDGANVWEW